MSDSLSRTQAAALGLVVLLAAAAGATGLVTVAAKQGVWADTFEVTVGFPDAQAVTPGTPVRVRGVDAGQVAAVEYPADDGPTAAVTVRLRLNAQFRGRLFADASAQVQPTGLLGGKVIAVSPGTTAAGPLIDGKLRPTQAADITAVADKLSAVADEADKLLKDVRAGRGTLGKLAADDALYDDLRAVAKETRGVAAKADKELDTVGATARSVQRTTDAFERSRLGRQFIDSPAAALVRPDRRREVMTYNTIDLFEPNSAILTDTGRMHLDAVGEWLKGADSRGEVVIACRCDETVSVEAAGELTRGRAAAAAEYLKAGGAHKIGWFSRRSVQPLGLGRDAPPVPGPGELPPSYLQVNLFTPP